jgi:type 1 glutamine amidotransferase
MELIIKELNLITNNYGKSRIVYIQLGHDHNSFDDRNYRQLIKQSIDWVVND